MSYLPTYAVNVGNWSSRHRGKIISFLQAPYQIGPLLMSVIYYSFFENNQEVKESFSFKTRMPGTAKCRPTVAY